MNRNPIWLASALLLVVAVGAMQATAQAVRCSGGGVLPQVPLAADEVRFAAVGDAGRGCGPDGLGPQCRLTNAMMQVRQATGFDLMFLLGDNVYKSGRPSNFPMRLYRPLAGLANNGVLVKGVLGNHDVLSKRGSRLQTLLLRARSTGEQTAFFNQVSSDDPEAPGKSAARLSYYEFSPKPALIEFFALDSSMLTGDCCFPFFWKEEFSAQQKTDQINWFKQALSASTAKWKVVVLHHPPYSSGKKHGVKVGSDGIERAEPKMLEIRRILTDVAISTGKKINLVLAGHEHFYERIKPMGGTQYFVSGAGSELRSKDLDAPLPTFHACGESTKTSFMLFSAGPSSVKFWAIDEGRNVIDSGEFQ